MSEKTNNNFYINVTQYGNKIFHKYWDYETNTKKFEVVKNFDIELFQEPSIPVNTPYKGLHKEPLILKHFDNIDDAKNFIKTAQRPIYGQEQFVYQFIRQNYPNEVSVDISKFNIANLDIETSFGKTKYKLKHEIQIQDKNSGIISNIQIKHFDNSVLVNDYIVYDEETGKWVEWEKSCYKVIEGFPSPDRATQEILAITFKLFGKSNKLITLGCKEYSKKDDEGIYIKCNDEEDLLAKFIHIWQKLDIDILTGWNCIPATQSVWTNNKIIPINNIKYKDKLYDSFVEHIFPKTNKNVCEIQLDNGQIVRSSKDHIFPIWKKSKNVYVDNIKTLVTEDATFNNIQSIIQSQDVYLKLELRNNTNVDLTYRELIKNNLFYLIKKGFEFKCRDSLIVKKITTTTGIKCWNNIKNSFWCVSNILKILSEKEIYDFLDRTNTLTIFSLDINKSSLEINLNNIISLEDLWLCGLWYTDGTQSYKTEVSITNKNSEIIKKTVDCLNVYRNKPLLFDKLIPDKNDCYNIGTGLSNIWFLKLFIYNHVKSCSKKQLSVNLLSQLSYNQFLSFYAGCIDGDGSISERGNVSLVNYNNDVSNFVELLQWNGIFSTQSNNSLNSYFKDENFKLYLTHNIKKEKYKCKFSYNRMSKSNNKRWIFDDNSVYVKVKNTTITNDIVEMVDISTNTAYFITKGIKTHNCTGFDIPYIINRIKRIFKNTPKELLHNKLSPLYKYIKNPIRDSKTDLGNLTYDIQGITILDYLDLYKKFSGEKLTSFSLNYVSKHEEIGQKIDYSNIGNLMDLYEKDYELYIDYNKQDVKLPELLEDKKRFIELALTLTSMVKAKHEDVLSPVRLWECHIYNVFANDYICIPPKKHTKLEEKIKGAFVKEPQAGFYRWILTLDATSLNRYGALT